MSEQEQAKKVEPAEPGEQPPQARPFAGWLLAEASIGLSIFSCVVRSMWSQYHWTLFDVSSPLTQGDREALYAFLELLRLDGWLFAGAALLCLLAGFFAKPRKAAWIALPFVLFAMLFVSMRE